VTLLYLGLNTAFLRAAPVEALRGEVAVGEIAARHLFGDAAARPVAALFALGLFASVSAMLWAGPRVLAAMGARTPSLHFLRPAGEAPVLALGIQAALAVVFILAASFRGLVTYTQTGLALCTLLTVAGLFRLRDRVPLRRLLLPATIFLAMTSFVVVRSVASDPGPTLAGLATAAAIALAGLKLNPRPSP
jgi:APA family basic amino acid/polyamine antiporter